TGYLGGEWNPIGGYFVVRQSDAHAWAEVWLQGRGWTRIDPAAVVAPERLRRGVFDLLPDALATRVRLLRGSAWLTGLLQRWDAANAWWSDHVVKFDYSAQLDLLGRFGIRSPDVRYLGWAFVLALLGWLALIAWHVGRSARPAPPDALARAYTRLCHKLGPTGPPPARPHAPRPAHDREAPSPPPGSVGLRIDRQHAIAHRQHVALATRRLPSRREADLVMRAVAVRLVLGRPAAA